MPHEKTVPLAQLAPKKLSTQQAEALNHALARFASEPGGLLPLLHAGMASWRIKGERLPGRWTDVGTPERLAELERELVDPLD